MIPEQTSTHMQTTLPLNPGNPLKNITGLARQIALPGEHVPLRFPSFPALERTAVMGFNQPASWAVSSSAAATNAMTVFRQACYPVWADQTFPVGASTGYFALVDYITDAIASSNAQAPAPLRSAVSSWTLTARAASGTQCAYTGPPATQVSTYPLFGKDTMCPGPEFTYVPAGCTFTLVFTLGQAAVAATAWTVDLEQWQSPGETGSTATSVLLSATGTIPISNWGGSATFPANTSGWVRPKWVSTNSTGASPSAGYGVTLVISTGTATYTPSITNSGSVTTAATAVAFTTHLPLVYPSEFINSALPWYATRVTAAAVLGTNVTQILNKGGTILGGRISPAVQNAWTVTSSYVSGLHPAEKAYLPMETGVYTYCPPSTDLVFFGDYTLNTSIGAAVAPLFLLSNDSMYNKLFLKTGTVDETLACTVSWHIEFRTSSALFQVGLSAMTLEALHQAQLVLAEAGFFFENPEHDGLLNRVISTAKKYAPTVVGAVNPVAGRLLQSVISKMGTNKAIKPKEGPSKPPTTTAAKSGVESKPKGKKPAQKKAKQKKK